MLRPRITPCLLVQGDGLVKTRQFGDSKYVGDPLNAVKIFNEKEADELIVLDIEATMEGRKPDYRLIRNIAAECRMPLCYGGGVKTVEEASRVVSLGVEKVAISSAIVEDPELLGNMSDRLGRQSVVAVLDVREADGGQKGWQIWTHRGTRNTKRSPAEVAKELEVQGVGEIVVNAIDRDGTMEGYDHKLIKRVLDAVNVPVTALGGAGSLDDVEELFRLFGLIGAAAGSIFVFKGRFRAVLISYPKPEAKREICNGADKR